MSNSQLFKFDDLKDLTIDSFIFRCREYVEQYLSNSEATRFYDAYKESDLAEVRYILEKTLKSMKNRVKDSEYQNAEKAVMDEFPDFKELFFSLDNKKGRHHEEMGDENMSTGSGMIAVIVILIAIVIAIVGTCLKIKNKTVGEVLSSGSKKNNGSGKTNEYSDKDRDLLELIHQLSIIYDNTEKYLDN